MPTPMTDDEAYAFLAERARTAKLATVRKDGSPHVAPVWFVLDGRDLLFTSDGNSVKSRSMRRDGRVALAVDDDTPPFDFVIVEGRVDITTDVGTMLPWATRIGARYMGSERGEEFGRRNAVEGELLVRLTPSKIKGYRAIAG